MQRIWKPKKLDELGFIGRGKSKHRPRNDPSLYGGSYPFIQTGDIKQANLYITHHTQTYNEKGLAQSKLWSPGTLCITIAANIAETAILKIKACFPDSVVGFIAYPDEADVRFVKYYIDMLKLKMQNISHGTTQDNLSLDKLLTFDILKPPLPIQRTIASILSSYDDLIENNTRRIAILEEMARMLYEEWFVKFRFPGYEQVKMVESELGMIPEGCKVDTVSSFGTIITGKTPSKSVAEYFANDFMPFIKTPDMHGNIFCIQTQDHLSEKGALSPKNKTLPPKSICVSCIGTVGVVSITAMPAQTNQQINSIVLNEPYYREFGYFTMRSLQGVIERFGSNGATMFNLNKGKFEDLKFIRPDSMTLEKFHHITYSVFELIKQLQQKNATLRRTRDLLLPKLISGEIGVSSWVKGDAGEIARELAAVGTTDVYSSGTDTIRRVAEAGLIEPIDSSTLERPSLWE